MEELLSPENTSYRPRGEMEDDPTFKQLIPYVIFQYTDPSGGRQVFQYTRGKGQGEQRLHAKRSIGIGGHISAEDANDAGDLHPYEEGMRRELEEEVAINTDYSATCIGMINDDETDVGKVHLGVVHLFEVVAPEVYPRETEIIDSGFENIELLNEDLNQFESWSQICLETLFQMG